MARWIYSFKVSVLTCWFPRTRTSILAKVKVVENKKSQLNSCVTGNDDKSQPVPLGAQIFVFQLWEYTAPPLGTQYCFSAYNESWRMASQPCQL